MLTEFNVGLELFPHAELSWSIEFPRLLVIIRFPDQDHNLENYLPPNK